MIEHDFFQCDWKDRVVALTNLEAMCEHVSGTAHRYWVSNVGEHTVRVTYSNPDEWGAEDPVTVILPCYRMRVLTTNPDIPLVVLNILKMINDQGEVWQAFDAVFNCPTLWRDPETKEWIETTEPKEKLNA